MTYMSVGRVVKAWRAERLIMLTAAVRMGMAPLGRVPGAYLVRDVGGHGEVGPRRGGRADAEFARGALETRPAVACHAVAVAAVRAELAGGLEGSEGMGEEQHGGGERRRSIQWATQ